MSSKKSAVGAGKVLNLGRGQDSTTILLKQFADFYKNPSPGVTAHINYENMFQWYVCMDFRDENYRDSMLHGMVLLLEFIIPSTNETFLFKPASVRFLSENGMFDLGTGICFSIGEYHSGAYPAAIGYHGTVNMIQGAILQFAACKGLGGGIGHRKFDEDKIRAAAVKSFALIQADTRLNQIHQLCLGTARDYAHLKIDAGAVAIKRDQDEKKVVDDEFAF